MKSFRYKNTLFSRAFATRASATRATTAPRAARRSVTNPRGAALVTAMLITLVLSGLGLIALHSVNDTTWKTANYRSRQQASQVSDAVVNLAVYRMGDAGHKYLGNMDSALKQQLRIAEEGGSDDGVDAATRKLALERRGPILRLARTPKYDFEHSMSYLFTGQDDDDDSDEQIGGIFDDAIPAADSPPSFSAQAAASKLDVDYRLIIRDSLDGPRASGFDDNYCFRKVSIASHGGVAPNLDHQAGEGSWKARTNTASNRNIVEAMVGPVPCGQ